MAASLFGVSCCNLGPLLISCVVLLAARLVFGVYGKDAKNISCLDSRDVLLAFVVLLFPIKLPS
jgi:hypothetical protein